MNRRLWFVIATLLLLVACAPKETDTRGERARLVISDEHVWGTFTYLRYTAILCDIETGQEYLFAVGSKGAAMTPLGTTCGKE